MECYVCGREGSKERLFEAVSKNGIIRLCAKCASQEDYPVVRKPTTFQLKEAEKEQEKSFYQTLKEKQAKKRFELSPKEKQEISLREIIDKNYEKKADKEKGPRQDLVDNFHWKIIRARRLKKISREQLAKEISESIAAIKMAEQGVLPEDDYRLVNKLESFLNIKIKKQEVPSFEKKSQPARILKIDREAAKDFTIDDLKKMKQLREEEIFGKGDFEPEDTGEKIIEGEEDGTGKEKDKETVGFVDLDAGEEKELTDEEIDRIIFGKG